MEIIVPAVAMVVVAIIEAIAAKDRKRTKQMNEKQEKRAEQRAKESLLSMQLIDATLQLSIVSANALTNGHNNGNVEEAKAAAEDARKSYSSFLQSITAQELNK